MGKISQKCSGDVVTHITLVYIFLVCGSWPAAAREPDLEICQRYTTFTTHTQVDLQISDGDVTINICNSKWFVIVRILLTDLRLLMAMTMRNTVTSVI
jgi:hypothetical protein